MRMITYIFYVKVTMKKNFFLEITELPFSGKAGMAILVRSITCNKFLTLSFYAKNTF